MVNLRPFDGVMPELGQRVWVDPSATVIGQVRLGDDVSIWPGCVVRGDVNTIDIGPDSNIQDLSVLHVTHDGPYTPGGRALIIGAGVTVGHQAVLHACTVGDHCLVGMGARLLDNVEMAPFSMVAAGSVVPPNKKIGEGELWRGAPAVPARLLSDEEREQLIYSAQHYVRLKDRYREAGQNS